jgi:hypothetical protein
VREIYALDYLHPAMMINDIETLLLEDASPAGPRAAGAAAMRGTD